MASDMFFDFDARHHALANLLGGGPTLVLPLTRVPLLKLQKQDAKKLYSKGSCTRIETPGQLQCFARITHLGQPAGFRLVLSRVCATQQSEAANQLVFLRQPRFDFCFNIS